MTCRDVKGGQYDAPHATAAHTIAPAAGSRVSWNCHLRDRVVGALGEGHELADFRLLNQFEKVFGERTGIRVVDDRRQFSPHHAPFPSTGPDFGVMPRTFFTPSKRAGEAV